MRVFSAVSERHRDLSRGAFGRLGTAVVVAVSLTLLMSVFVLRLVSDDPGTAVLTLYVLPIGLIAAAAGIRLGLATAALCLAAVFLWASLDDAALSPLGYFVRALLFSTAALAGAALTDRRLGRQSLRAWLPEGASSAGAARELLREICRLGVRGAPGDAQLLVTELVTNVIEHGKGVRIELRAGTSPEIPLGRAPRLAPALGALDARLAHQPLDAPAADLFAGASERHPHPAVAVGVVVGGVQLADRFEQSLVLDQVEWWTPIVRQAANPDLVCQREQA